MFDQVEYTSKFHIIKLNGTGIAIDFDQPYAFGTVKMQNSFLLYGGEGGIRTLGTLFTHTRFPGVHLKPLGHLS